MLVLKHIRKKKLIYDKKYKTTFFDSFMYLVAFAGPIMTLPQIYDIWAKRSANLNTVTWGSYLIIGLLWLLYGMIHKEKPIIFSNLLGVITNVLVLSGTLIYR